MARPSLLLPLFVAALGCSPDVGRPPALPGPETGEGTSGGGAGGGGLDGGPTETAGVIRGSLCRVVDLRRPESCTSGDLGGIDIVAVGETTTSTVSAANGTFSLASPGGDVALIDVAAATADFKETILELPLRGRAATDVRVPLVPIDVWEQLVADLQTLEPNGTGTLAVFVRDAQTPVEGATIIEPAGAFAPFFDTATDLGFDTLGPTGTAGASLIFGVPAIGDANFTVIGPDGQSIPANAPVQEDALGISFIDLGRAR